MPKKKADDRPQFLDALAEVAAAKGLSYEDVIAALEEAIQKAYIKYLGGGDDATVICEVNSETGEVKLGQVKKVLEDDDITDDYLEISVEEANEGLKKPKYKAGDDCFIACPTETISLVTAAAIKNNLRQKLAEAERAALYEVYKDHIGEIVTGMVEKSDDRSVTVSIGRATIEMGRKELIGDEFFRVGDPIKVYIQEVRQPLGADGQPKKGPQIEATRSSDGFLRCLFEEEIHEIYDGTVVIKAIARQAGVRSKVAVASKNEDVDATGACIGPGGNRIQKIVSQLGGGNRPKEKIDVLNYYESDGAFVIESCRPVLAIGASIDKEEKKAKVIINDGDYPLALGKYSANRNLASKISGYDIEFVELSKAIDLGLTWTTAEEWKEIAEAEKKAAEKEAYLNKLRAEEAKRLEEEAKRKEAEEAKRLEEERAKAAAEEEARKEEEARIAASRPTPAPTPAPAPRAAAKPEEFPAEAINPAAAAMAALRKAEEEAKAAEAAKAEEKVEEKAEEPIVEAKPEPKPEEPVIEATSEVKTTTTLEDLEKELEAAKEKKTRSTAKKRPRKITEEEVKRDTTPVATRGPAVQAMPVYTEEELAEMEEEERDAYDDVTEEDIDEEYSEYDEYYDDDGDR